jgi:hypothetical protein
VRIIPRLQSAEALELNAPLGRTRSGACLLIWFVRPEGLAAFLALEPMALPRHY